MTLASEDKTTCAEDIDRVICPELPDIDRVICAELPDIETDPLAFETITMHMIHGPCGTSIHYVPCIDCGTCTKHYPKVFSSDTII